MVVSIKTRYWILSYVCCPYFRFLYKFLLFMPIPGHYTPMFPCSYPNRIIFTLHFLSGFALVGSIQSIRLWEGLCHSHFSRCANLAAGVNSNGWFCTGVRKTILAQNFYCDHPNTDTNSQSGSQVHKWLGNWDLWITWECDLVTAIAIHLLNQPLIWKMGSSIFAAISQLKVTSNTWYFLPIIPST